MSFIAGLHASAHWSFPSCSVTTEITAAEVLKFPTSCWLQLGAHSPQWKQRVTELLNSGRVSTFDLGIQDFENFQAFVHNYGADLTYLKICGCKFLKDEEWELLQQLPGLLELNIQGCSYFSDRVLNYLLPLNQLQVLTVWQPEMTDAGLAIIKRMPIEELHLVRCKCTAQGFAQLGAWKGLRVLNLCRLPRMKLQDLDCLRLCPDLQKLEFIHPLTGLKPLVDRQLTGLANLTCKDLVIGHAAFHHPEVTSLGQVRQIRFLNCAFESQAKKIFQDSAAVEYVN